MRGVGGGVGVSVGKKGLGVCRMKAASALLGVKGIITQTMRKGIRQETCRKETRDSKILFNMKHIWTRRQ